MRRRTLALFVCAGFAAALITATFGTAGCGSKSAASAGGTISTSAFFPAGKAIPGWARGQEVRTFSATELSNYIDGDAEKYIKVGVQSTATADYRFQNKFDAVADIYSFANASGPKAIYDAEPPGDAASPNVGEAARLYGQSLVYRKGRYLVRIVAYEASPQMQQAILDLGKAIEAKLEQ